MEADWHDLGSNASNSRILLKNNNKNNIYINNNNDDDDNNNERPNKWTNLCQAFEHHWLNEVALRLIGKNAPGRLDCFRWQDNIQVKHMPKRYIFAAIDVFNVQTWQQQTADQWMKIDCLSKH